MTITTVTGTESEDNKEKTVERTESTIFLA